MKATRRGLTRNPGSQRAVDFINRLTHVSGPFAGKDFNLRAWQEHDVIRPLFSTGTDGRRRYRTCLLMLPRKNGKSSLAAAIALYGLLHDNEMSASVVSAAADREQAALVFNIAAQMVRNDVVLSAMCEIVESQKRIVYRQTGSVYKAISAEAYSKHGGNISMLIYDELHCAPNRDLWDVLTTSMGARSQPLTLAISTAGYDRHSILWELYDHAKKVQENPSLDPTFLPLLYEMPVEADWTDEREWKKCNPALGDFRSLEDMRIACARAKEIPSQQNTFRRLFCNQWTEQAERWIDMAAWDACQPAGAPDWKALRERMKGKPCFGGMDLSSRSDLTALVLVFQDDDGGLTAVPFFWVPEEGAAKRSRKDRVPYEQWIRDGLITATSGSTVDQSFIRADINRIATDYRLKELGFDPWNASKIETELEGDGIHIVEVRQGFPSLSGPTKDLGALVTSRKLRHGGHPVLRWMASNMVVGQDPAGNLKPDRSKVTEKIDGIVALIIGMHVAIKNTDQEPEFQAFFVGGR